MFKVQIYQVLSAGLLTSDFSLKMGCDLCSTFFLHTDFEEDSSEIAVFALLL